MGRRGLSVSSLWASLGFLLLSMAYLFSSSRPVDLLPMASLLIIVVGCYPWILCWKRSRHLPLRPAITWAVLAMILAATSQLRALSEPYEGGRPETGLLAYLAMAAMMTATTSVFGARRPGVGAWALLMIMLFGVMLAPLLEASVFSSKVLRLDRIRLEAPWSLFIGLVAFTGVTNYLPTRWVLPSAVLAASFATTFLAMISPQWTPESRAIAWSIGAGLMGLSSISSAIGLPRMDLSNELDRHWFWFRDRWGVVWALRVSERFNQTAERCRWPIRLGWHGSQEFGDPNTFGAGSPAEAVTTLRLLMKRFGLPAEDGLSHDATATES